MQMAYSLIHIFGSSLIAIVLGWYLKKRPIPRYPPGPKPWPLIGNVLDIPSKNAPQVYQNWGRLYGQDIVHFEVFGQHMAVVNSRELAHELFEKRSLIYSDRPVVPVVDIMGWTDIGIAFMPYGDTWRQHRRLFQEGFRESAAEHLPIQMEKTHQLLVNLLKDPANFRAHIRTLTAATIMGIVYGHDVASSNDYFVDLAEKANVPLTTLSSTTSAAIVNMLPFTRHLPAWLPGFGFLRILREARGQVNDMVEKPYSLVIDRINTGCQKPSLLARYLDQYRVQDNDDQGLSMIKQVCGFAYAGMNVSFIRRTLIDHSRQPEPIPYAINRRPAIHLPITISALASFFLAMARHPHVQRKAQEQIDDLLDGARLPTWGDRSDLQYVEAIMRETFRWRPVTTLGFFHSTLSDDMVNGYFIPKGTAISGNIWAMTRDPTLYPDPEEFVPERFLTEDGICNNEDMVFTFGFAYAPSIGRRICPGRHLAINTLWAAMACILAVFDISKAKDEAGAEVEPDAEYTVGIVSPGDRSICLVPPASHVRLYLLRPVAPLSADLRRGRFGKIHHQIDKALREDLVHFEVFGQHMMIVNSRELAHELFDKRSLIYSDRPQVPMIDFLRAPTHNDTIRMGWTRNGFTFMPYGSTWRQHRRLFQEGFRDPATSYLPILTAKTHELLLNLLNDSGNFRDHIRTVANVSSLTAAIIMGIVYGHDVTSADDHFVTLAEKANETLLTLGATGASVVNMFPFMRHFPAWLPGCGFQRSAREARNRIESMVEEPYTLVVDQINSGVQKPSFLARYLERYRTDSGDDEQELLTIKRVCALAYAAGADTTISALAAFFIAMASYPHVQERAQEHIDNLLGNERLPAWEDRPKLQYIEAIIREVLRWRPIAPLGLFHAAMNDDTVNGYFVPKGQCLDVDWH
ncbi:hypothetical protein VNI00_006024 [Paramarasmius palmivorus]|uniref:Cytochrome P450 n=1 Tax=Paramarasmius palmivorus TaxID=297713 RepID=A0AAW0DED1_9AGAR